MDGSQPCATDQSNVTWFPENWKAGKAAISVCQTCKYRIECLEYALHINVVGIWGGTTETQRQAIRKERGIKVTPVWMTIFAPSQDALRLRAKRAAEQKREN